MTACVSMLLKSRASLTCFRACFLPGRAKDLSAPRYYTHGLTSVFMFTRCNIHISAFLHPIMYIFVNVWPSKFIVVDAYMGRSQRPCGLKRGSAGTRLMRLRVRIPPGHGWLSLVSVVCCPGEACVGFITRPVESYRLWSAWVWSWNLDNEAVAY